MAEPLAPVLAATKWKSNAEMIARAVVPLGYLRPDDLTVDVTWGRGIWWKDWAPAELVRHDLYTLDGVDFTALPEDDDTYDAVVFDPPYAPMGGKATSTLGDYANRYGRDNAPATPEGIQKLVDAGLAECARVVRPSRLEHGEPTGGIILVKCADFIWGGSLRVATHDTLETARALGLELVDRFIHVGHSRPQPGGRTRKHPPCRGRGCDGCDAGRVPTVQGHARQNFSVLYVLRAPRATAPPPEVLFDEG